MKIEINLKIIFVIILFLIFNSLDIYIMFLVFVFLHEVSHLMVGILIGGKPQKMNINPLGISLEIYSYGKNKPLNKIIFYLSGPLMNLLLAIIFYYINLEIILKEKIIYTNMAICLFNLLPILPLDGGKVLKEIFGIFFGKEMSNIIMINFSKVFLGFISLAYSILILKLKNIYILVLLVYLWYLYFIEEKKYLILIKTMEEIKKYNKVLK